LIVACSLLYSRAVAAKRKLQANVKLALARKGRERVKKRRTSDVPIPPDRVRLEWLLTFLRVDIDAMRPGALLDLLTDVFEMLQLPALASVTEFDDPDLRALKPARVDATDPIVVLKRDLLTRLQRALRTGVDALSDRGSWAPFGLIAAHGVAPRWTFERRADGVVVRAYVGAWLPITIGAAADLLVHAWPELRRCKYASCGVLFLPEEGRQRYHDPKCSARARWHRLPPRDHQKEKERRVLGNGPGRGRKAR
jgi:hypothetical protein